MFYRFYYPIKRIVYTQKNINNKSLEFAKSHPKASFPTFSNDRNLFDPTEKTFSFLNLTKKFGTSIYWEFSEYGMLWTFHLHYFDWLNDNEISLENRLGTIREHIEKQNKGFIFNNSFIISIKIRNWIKFILSNGIKDEEILKILYAQAHRLATFPEYDIDGNHLLENGISLVWAGYYFNDQKFITLGEKILLKQLNIQILNDGAHFEKSPAYHTIILKNLLELKWFFNFESKDSKLDNILNIKCTQMLSYLSLIAGKNKIPPAFGDSNEKMFVSLDELKIVAQILYIDSSELDLDESGFRILEGKNFRLLFNKGNIPASYQPGHTHADAFNFCLSVNNQAVIVDRGVSTYEKNTKRLVERSTTAHNTLSVEKANSAAVWGGFRMGRRPGIKTLSELSNSFEYQHNGFFKKYKIFIGRSIIANDYSITITDKIEGWSGQLAKIYFHFHPDITIEKNKKEWIINNSDLCLSLEIEDTDSYLEDYEYCIGFNETKIAKRIVVSIDNEITITTINTKYEEAN